MNKRTSIVNISGDHEETLIQLARHLGTSQIRRKIFDTVYGPGTRPRSKRQIMEKAGISDTGTKAQQVQNELDHLSKHHLIVKSENNGVVADGSRNLYGKDESVRANRKKIIRLADNPKAADRIPTKRRPALEGVAPIQRVTKRDLKKKKHLNVLYLASNPDPQCSLRIDAEIRLVQQAIRGTVYRDSITVQYRPAANLDSLLEGLNDHRPQIVHFSGHGNETEIATDSGGVEDPAVQSLSFDLLAKALSATDSPPEIVVLNSCKSSAAKKHLLPVAKVIITMRESISDVAAAAFAPRFYAALASGQPVQKAFAQGQVAVAAASISEANTPELHCAAGINPAKVILT